MLLAAEELARQFEGYATSGQDMSGLGRAEEDARLRAMLHDKAEALSALEAELATLIVNPEAEVAIDAMEMLADAYLHMGQSIRDYQPPTYLDEKQNEVYATGLDHKAFAQERRGLEHLDRAAKRAADAGFAGRSEALSARASAIRADRAAAADVEPAATD
jgi:hypothetical protein